jgi:hypothetical protein
MARDLPTGSASKGQKTSPIGEAAQTEPKTGHGSSKRGSALSRRASQVAAALKAELPPPPRKLLRMRTSNADFWRQSSQELKQRSWGSLRTRVCGAVRRRGAAFMARLWQLARSEHTIAGFVSPPEDEENLTDAQITQARGSHARTPPTAPRAPPCPFRRRSSGAL